MTGKFLVFVQLGFSVLVSAIALAVFANRVDLSGPEGEHARKKKELEAAAAGYRTAERAWTTSAPILAAENVRRIGDESSPPKFAGESKWFLDQINHLEERATTQDPARMIVVDDKGLPLPGKDPNTFELDVPKDKDGKVILDRDGQPIRLRSLRSYNEEGVEPKNRLNTRIMGFLDRITAAAKNDEDLTKQLTGPKGLYARLDAERLKKAGILVEILALRPKYQNTRIEVENFKELEDRLEIRLKELRLKLPRETTRR